jgi:ribosomal protein S12 methylthiotransferase
MITGFPGENQKEYEELRRFVETVEFDRLGVFIYSEEEGTYAARKYKDSISEKVKKERADDLMKLQQSISMKLNLNKIGRSFKVMIDRREGEYYIGRTWADSPEVDNEVLIPVSGKKLSSGNFYMVKITGAGEFDIFGDVV